ncbi:hypothetical protein L798_00360 [Zootermopsis nevadensis]|uniref:Uncharacterized protein n=1 Tax=Zootermopsis nevadensis TaxID=136037 RepID=A0A067QYD1_ZOONE|nr:hypothetical protein L798_00360 [Zootermopsis nevadensis]
MKSKKKFLELCLLSSFSFYNSFNTITTFLSASFNVTNFTMSSISIFDPVLSLYEKTCSKKITLKMHQSSTSSVHSALHADDHFHTPATLAPWQQILVPAVGGYAAFRALLDLA